MNLRYSLCHSENEPLIFYTLTLRSPTPIERNSTVANFNHSDTLTTHGYSNSFQIVFAWSLPT